MYAVYVHITVAMDTFITRFGLTQVNAAKETSLFVGGKYNEKTIQYWRKDFYNNHGEFSESLQGKHNRPFILYSVLIVRFI